MVALVFRDSTDIHGANETFAFGKMGGEREQMGPNNKSHAEILKVLPEQWRVVCVCVVWKIQVERDQSA